MLLGIDHLVIAVRDPDAAASTIERRPRASRSPAAGGTSMGDVQPPRVPRRHVPRAHRRVRSSAGGIADGSAVGRATVAVLDAGREGLATFALATDDVDGDVGRLRAAGSPSATPVDGSRVRPDGEVVRWRTAARRSSARMRPPFLIEHEHAGAEWGDGARAAREAFRHPGGGRVRLARLDVPCADPVAAASAYEATVGIAFESSGADLNEARAGAHVVRLSRDTGAEPVVDLVGAWPEPIDLVQLGIRWRGAR